MNKHNCVRIRILISYASSVGSITNNKLSTMQIYYMNLYSLHHLHQHFYIFTTLTLFSHFDSSNCKFSRMDVVKEKKGREKIPMSYFYGFLRIIKCQMKRKNKLQHLFCTQIQNMLALS